MNDAEHFGSVSRSTPKPFVSHGIVGTGFIYFQLLSEVNWIAHPPLNRSDRAQPEAIMERLLYLDTARIGRITPGAQRAFIDYLTLVGQEGGSSYFERFLRHGLADCPSWMKNAYPSLNCWNGIESLKHSLRTLAGSQAELPVLLSLRTSQLMKLAARLMLRNCSNVLTTDLGWPSYYITLEAERVRSNATTTTVAVRNVVLERGATERNGDDGECCSDFHYSNELLTAWPIPMPDEYNIIALQTVPNSLKN